MTDEVKKHGDVITAHAVPESPGHLFMLFESEEAAAKCVSSLNGRWFAGKQVSADTVSEDEMPSRS